MKTWLYLLVVAVISFSLVGAGCASPTPSPTPGAPAAAAPAPAAPVTYPKTELNLATVLPAPPSGPTTQAMQWAVDEVSKRSGGQVAIKVFWAGSMAKAGEEVQAVKGGLVDMAQVVYAYTPSVLPLSNLVFWVPFGPANPKVTLEAYRALYANVPAFKQDLEQFNQKVLGITLLDTYDILTKNPVKTLDDLKGMKIAAIGTGYPKWFEAIGAVAVALPITERYNSMQTGVVEGSFLAADLHYSLKLYELAKNYTHVSTGAPAAGALTINADVWNRLSPQVQQLLQQVFHEGGDKYAELISAERQVILDKMKAAGVTFYTLSQADREKWANVLPDYPKQWATDMEAKGLPGWQVVDLFLKTVEQQGYTFPRKWGQR
ncbi:MAG TPA: C4-dicarboxylate TRAP transporter substrate-binding protein [Thermoleophilia bacterium]|nr:C4-dicarboxylate TRAP transporter substrate-binding protein [Thermoleophilia bacterium]